MNTKVFVIVGEHRDRDCYEYSCWPVCVVANKPRAEEIVSKLTRLTEYNSTFEQRVKNEFTYSESRVEIPLKPSPSPEFSRLRNIICVNLWKKDLQKAQNIKTEQYRHRKEAEKKWKEENYSPPFEVQEVVRLAKYTYSDVSYSFEELEMFE